MTFDEALSATVRQAVAEAVEPLRAELERLRRLQGQEPVSIVEAARLLGISTRTVRRKLNAGELEAVGTGRSRRVRLPTMS